MSAWESEDVRFCPFCGSDDIDWRSFQGTCHCADCGAIFSVDEDDNSERVTESEAEE